MSAAVARVGPCLLLSVLAYACAGPKTPLQPSSTSAGPVAAAGAVPAETLDGASPVAGAAGPTTITFLGSDPAPGGETALTEFPDGFIYLRDLRMQVGILRIDSPLPDAKVQFELLTDAEQVCAFTFIDQPVRFHELVTVAVDTGWNWEDACHTFPAVTASVRVTLLTLRDVGGARLQRTEYAVQTFPVGYTIRRYPAPPPHGLQTPPAISELSWSTNIPTGGDPPIAGDPVTLACTTREPDGAHVMIALTETWDGAAPKVYKKFFPPGAVSSESGALFIVGTVAPNTAPIARATIECVATNDRGQTARRTMAIGPPR